MAYIAVYDYFYKLLVRVFIVISWENHIQVNESVSRWP